MFVLTRDEARRIKKLSNKELEAYILEIYRRGFKAGAESAAPIAEIKEALERKKNENVPGSSEGC